LVASIAATGIAFLYGRRGVGEIGDLAVRHLAPSAVYVARDQLVTWNWLVQSLNALQFELDRETRAPTGVQVPQTRGLLRIECKAQHALNTLLDELFANDGPKPFLREYAERGLHLIILYEVLDDDRVPTALGVLPDAKELSWVPSVAREISQLDPEQYQEVESLLEGVVRQSRPYELRLYKICQEYPAGSDVAPLSWLQQEINSLETSQEANAIQNKGFGQGKELIEVPLIVALFCSQTSWRHFAALCARLLPDEIAPAIHVPDMLKRPVAPPVATVQIGQQVLPAGPIVLAPPPLPTEPEYRWRDVWHRHSDHYLNELRISVGAGNSVRIRGIWDADTIRKQVLQSFRGRLHAVLERLTESGLFADADRELGRFAIELCASLVRHLGLDDDVHWLSQMLLTCCGDIGPGQEADDGRDEETAAERRLADNLGDLVWRLASSEGLDRRPKIMQALDLIASDARQNPRRARALAGICLDLATKSVAQGAGEGVMTGARTPLSVINRLLSEAAPELRETIRRSILQRLRKLNRAPQERTSFVEVFRSRLPQPGYLPTPLPPMAALARDVLMGALSEDILWGSPRSYAEWRYDETLAALAFGEQPEWVEAVARLILTFDLRHLVEPSGDPLEELTALERLLRDAFWVTVNGSSFPGIVLEQQHLTALAENFTGTVSRRLPSSLQPGALPSFNAVFAPSTLLLFTAIHEGRSASGRDAELAQDAIEALDLFQAALIAELRFLRFGVAGLPADDPAFLRLAAYAEALRAQAKTRGRAHTLATQLECLAEVTREHADYFARIDAPAGLVEFYGAKAKRFLWLGHQFQSADVVPK
jgi:hypothetical protein